LWSLALEKEHNFRVSIVAFWLVTQHSLVGCYLRFEEHSYLHLQGWRWQKCVPLKRW